VTIIRIQRMLASLWFPARLVATHRAGGATAVRVPGELRSICT